ncbi:hypothetical protein Golomagni_05654 [Golovinomyces magnicellulatus]|nr:hypothetical protein Golomagni_05654 [Golovinomyces magnicellulatus]
MLYRHSVLVIDYLRTHPEFKNPESRRSVKPLLERIGQVLEDLETLKPEIERIYKEWERRQPAKEAPRKLQKTPSPSYAHFASRDPTLSGNAKILDASQHQELAVDLAQEELGRRDELRRSRKRLSKSKGHGKTDDTELQRQIEATRNTLDRARHGLPVETHPESVFSAARPANYSYPTVSRSQPVNTLEQQVFQPPQLPAKFDHGQPLRPPKETLVQSGLPADSPLLPPKAPLSGPPVPKKERLTFKPGAYLENGDPIRSLFIPSKLRQSFLDVAAKNTAAGLEMCGMLCGTPVNNALFVRCLLIPDQKSTSDTCETENEGILAEYCMNEDLLVLGWIHTHPTQTCFMSSRDLHTHAGYQVMMPESVAIVCAPKFSPSYGIFRLTHPPGLGHILDCKKTETFHQHSVTNLYCETEHPHGHVYESDKMPFYVHDLRTK